MVRDTPPYGHAPTHQISLTYLERQKCYGPDKKILFKKQLFVFFHFCFFCFFSVKLVRTITFLSFQIGQWYSVCGCMTIRRCVAYHNDLHGTQLFDLEVNGQGPTKVITVHDTPPYGHAPTYQISLNYLERQKCYGPDNKILFKKQLFGLEVKGQGPTKVIIN
jgi:hypothetical protein